MRTGRVAVQKYLAGHIAERRRAPKDGLIAPDRAAPHRADVGRHLGFGLGIHSCIGAPLAWMEVRSALERLPGLRLAPGPPVQSLPDFMHRGPRRLLVEWNPA